MTKRQMQDYLQDILDAVAAIEQFTTGIEFETFSQNLEKVFAVSRAIKIKRLSTRTISIGHDSLYATVLPPVRELYGNSNATFRFLSDSGTRIASIGSHQIMD